MSIAEDIRDHRYRNWTPEKEQELKQYVDRGLSAAQIGAIIGSTRDAVIGKIHRMGWALKEAADDWTAEESEIHRNAWSTGLTAAEIADEIYRRCGTKRSPKSIFARAYRIGLTKRSVRKRLLRRGYTRLQLVELDPPQTSVLSRNIPFMELQPIHCREITGRGTDGLASYCGHKTVKGQSFCPFHQRQNYYKPEPAKREF